MSVVSCDNAQHYVWGHGCDGWHLAKSEALSVIQERVPPGATETPHTHARAEQFFFVLSGDATIISEGVTHLIKPQHGLHVPAGQYHQLRNDGATDLHFIVISTPPSHGDRTDHNVT